MTSRIVKLRTEKTKRLTYRPTDEENSNRSKKRVYQNVLWLRESKPFFKVREKRKGKTALMRIV